jgi:peroxisome-assembly ATPase
MVQDKAVMRDPLQVKTLTSLQALHEQLLTYEPTVHVKVKEDKGSMFSRWFGASSAEPKTTAPQTAAPKGVYIWGGVGCGKTFMMDLFFEELPTLKKRRAHFNNFMIDIHKRLHKLKTDPATRSADDSHIHKIASDLANEFHVVCFDEFQVVKVK